MKIIELSNHPKDMLQPAHDRAEAALVQKQSAYKKACIQHQDKIKSLELKLKNSKGLFAWCSRFFLTKRIEFLAQSHPVAPVLEPPVFTDEELKWKAGLDVEDSVVNLFANSLNDEWTLIKGYRNRTGEIDQLLLGPQALVALEIKGNNAAIEIKDDIWYATKFDNYGNKKEQYLIQDKTGRSPSRQLKDSVKELETHLKKNKQNFTFLPIVFLPHSNVTLTFLGTTTVNVTNHPDYIWDWIESQNMNFDSSRIEEIIRLIIKDHNRNSRS